MAVDHALTRRRLLPAGLQPRLLMLALIPVAVAGVLTAVAAGGTVRQTMSDEAETTLAQMTARAEQDLAATARRMRAYATIVAGKAALVLAADSSDIVYLTPSLAALFKELHAEDPTVAIMEMTDSRGRILARGHNPERGGDDKSKVADVKAALAGNVGVGAEVSPTTGELEFGAALPLRAADGSVKGTIKVGARLNVATSTELARAVGSDILLFGGQQLKYSTAAGVDAATLSPEILASVHEGRSADLLPVVGPGHEWLASVRPIRNLEGRTVGAVAVLLPAEPYQQATRLAMLAVSLSALLMLGLTLPVVLLTARRIARPLTALVGVMDELRAGDLAIEIPGVGHAGEVGRMATALHAFRDGIAERLRLEAVATAEARAKDERAERMATSVRRFQEDAAAALRQVLTTASELDRTSGEMIATAQDGSRRAASLAACSEQASVSVKMVSASAEEIAASVAETARRLAESSLAAKQAAAAAANTNETVRELSASTRRIGEVVKLIADVAGRTNLLALNATIEAARAGEHGRGFAVVASEVKQLAQQTAKAADEIVGQIAAIQSETAQAVTAISSITDSSEKMDTLVGQIAISAKEQSTTMAEIGRAVAEAARGTQDVSEHAMGVTEGATQTGVAACQVAGSAGELAKQAEELRQRVEGFLRDIQMG